MIIRCLLGVVLSVGFLSGTSRAQEETVTVPLEVIPVTATYEGDSNTFYKLGIWIGLGGGSPKLYEFDTGSSGFFAGYNSQWWPSFTSTGISVDQNYHSGISYESAAVTTTVTFFTGGNPEDTTTATVSNAGVGQISTASFGGPGYNPVPDWTGDVAADIAPLYQNFFGDFGMALEETGSEGDFPGLFGILPQLPDNLASGFIVRVGPYPRNLSASRGSLQIGLTQTDRDSFPIQFPMKQGSRSVPYPNPAGNPVPNYTFDKELLDGAVMLSGHGSPFTFDAKFLFDTGQPSTDIHDADNAFNIPNRYLENFDTNTHMQWSVKSGDPSTLTELLEFLIGNATGYTAASVQTNVTNEYVNTGLNLFFRYDVMFDVENGIIGFSPVVVPPAPVPVPVPAVENPTVQIPRPGRRIVRRSVATLRGHTNSAANRIEYKVGAGGKARRSGQVGKQSWVLTVRGLRKGRNVVYVRAIDAAGGATSWRRIAMIRR